MEKTSWQPYVLLVDDNTNNLLLVERILKSEGYLVHSETSSMNALAVAEKKPPDLILLDISMPVIDGYEVCQRLKGMENLKDVPVIFLSAMSDVFDKVKAFSVGGVDYITKPIELEEFLARIQNHLRIGILQKQLEEKNAILEAEIARRSKAEEDLKHIAATDPLTKIFNRRSFFDLAEKELSRSQRFNTALSVVMVDIDHFKNVNDTYGHILGDQVLIAFAELCQKNLRQYDIFARYGGEEFIVLLPETDISQAMVIAKRLQTMVAGTQIAFNGDKVSITISLGVSSNEGELSLTLDQLVDRADQALYSSKQSGRNKVSLWQ
jgi:diguanylate cyclase (GGDEF)-like protein